MLLELMDESAPSRRELMIGDTTHDLAARRERRCGKLAVSYGARIRGAAAGLARATSCTAIAELRDWLATHG